LSDDDVDIDAPQIEHSQEGGTDRRSRFALALIVMLLLLLCTVTTIVDVWVRTPVANREFIVRNLACLQCHTELIPDMNKPYVHQPFLKQQCTTCHTPHGREVVQQTITGPAERWQRLSTLVEWLPLRLACQAGASPAGIVETSGTATTTTKTTREKGAVSSLRLPEQELCWTCHGDLGPLRSMAYQHAPFQNGYCTACHDPHASDYRALIKVDERQLCITCHPIGIELNRTYTHPPAANLWCLTCHNPHASDYQGILVTDQKSLCFTCHPTVAPLSQLPVQHAPFANGDCTGCHEPHGSNYAKLLVEGQPDLCYRCHPTIRDDFQQPSHHPVGTLIGCADSHEPHASNYQFLLKGSGNSFCYKCHGVTIQHTYDASKHKNLPCWTCHTPHGSPYTPLLIKPNPDLCLDCHGWIDHQNSHPYTPNYYDRVKNAPLTCTSTCHDPHGTSYNYMLRNFWFPFDGQCLQCHTDVGKTY
jgi:predicted CXXCH cytochrome family protein